jgi:hypothetical protein
VKAGRITAAPKGDLLLQVPAASSGTRPALMRVVALPFLTYDISMSAIEFEAELHGEPVLAIPPDVAARLPKSGRATVVVLVQDDDQEDRQWQLAAYEQFMKDDSSEDSVYDAYQ